MPEIKHYEVEQTRTVKVAAKNIVDAGIIASQAFDGNGPDTVGGVDPWGHTVGHVVVTRLDISKEY